MFWKIFNKKINNENMPVSNSLEIEKHENEQLNDSYSLSSPEDLDCTANAINIPIDTVESRKPNIDYVKTIFLQRFQKHPYKADDSFPAYFQYEFEIISMPTFFNEILSEGLLAPASLAETLGMLKVSDLKSILVENNLKKSGNKADLIHRIIENVDASLIPIAEHQYYSLSYDGHAFLEAHKDYIKLHQHSEWGIGFWEYQKLKDEAHESQSFNDIILSILDEKIKLIKKRKQNMSQYEYSRLNELYLSSYELYRESSNYPDALKSLLSSALLSVSGCENFWLIDYKWGLKLTTTQILSYYKPIHISPYIASEIRNLQKYYTIDILENVYTKFIGPYNFCTFEMFCSIVDEIFSVSILDLSPYDSVVMALFIKKLNKPRNH